MTDARVHVFPDLEVLSQAAAESTVSLMRDAPEDRPFTLVLAGGGTPRLYHELLAGPFREAIPWERVHLFWGDERFVAPDHHESNFHMAEQTLLRHVPVPRAQIHRVPTDGVGSPEVAAIRYEQRLREVLPDGDATFDLTILGLGGDGHTASLFPGTPALDETERWTAAAVAPANAAVRERVTLTYPVLNRSRQVFFLVSGAGKREPLRAILDDPAGAGAAFPASRIRAAEAVHWFVDEAAFGQE